MTACTNKPTAPPPSPYLTRHNPPPPKQTGTGAGGNTRDWAQARDLHLPLWCRRLGPLRRLAEETAAGAFRRTQDPMKVRDCVVVGVVFFFSLLGGEGECRTP